MKAIWIWENSQAKHDEYADFKTSFQLKVVSAPVKIRLSVDSYYGVYVNGKLAAFGQYADFPHCKIADTHDITSYCHEGENTVEITVWYHGAASAIYYPGKAGLFFEISQEDAMLAVSDTDTLSRINPYFVSYREKKITIVLITHHMDEAAKAQRVIVMNKGNVIIDGSPSDVFSQVELLHNNRLSAPDTVELCHALNQQGFSLPLDRLDAQECAQAIFDALK